ncbi:hypothetical protein [Nostoc sp. MS1]|uniref:hypothetical protein n=1 Tax=Nostoc sp. MS1 TaxID=2764711 RepID=UPI001CC5FE4C|nr:hypothetical protein [Nostoc sp. MS1]
MLDIKAHLSQMNFLFLTPGFAKCVFSLFLKEGTLPFISLLVPKLALWAEESINLGFCIAHKGGAVICFSVGILEKLLSQIVTNLLTLLTEY